MLTEEDSDRDQKRNNNLESNGELNLNLFLSLPAGFLVVSGEFPAFTKLRSTWWRHYKDVAAWSVFLRPAHSLVGEWKEFIVSSVCVCVCVCLSRGRDEMEVKGTFLASVNQRSVQLKVTERRRRWCKALQQAVRPDGATSRRAQDENFSVGCN